MRWVLVALILGCGTPESVTSVPERAELATDWSREIALLDSDIGAAEERLINRPGQWLIEAQLASLFSERARLTGDYEDYARAEEAVERAFDIAPEGSGPFLIRASLNFTLHRIDAVEADLVNAENAGRQTAKTGAAISLLRGRVAMERGQYDAALVQYQRSLELQDTLQVHAALAHHAWQTGDPQTGEAELSLAEGRYHGRRAEPRAWFHLQRAIADLDAGRTAEARIHLDHADTELPGYWLIEEHIAEIMAIHGELEGALALYASVVDRTNSPELMGAMAGVLSALDRDVESALWVARADAVFAERLKRFPEAVTGHALEHALDFGDPASAVALAEANVALRPNGAALEQLARAYTKASRPEEARSAVARAKALGWAGDAVSD